MKFWITEYEHQAFCLGIVFAFNETPKELSIALGWICLNFRFGKNKEKDDIK